MITAYRVSGDMFDLSVGNCPDGLPDDVIWIDMLYPDKAEEARVEALLSIEVPTREDLKDIEPSSRLYTEDGATYMTGSLVCKADAELPELADIAFILAHGRLITIRYGEPKSFALFIAALHRTPGVCTNGERMLLKLLETVVDRTAEILEHAVLRIDALSRQVFGEKAKSTRRPPRYLEDRLHDVAGHHRLVSKARDSLLSLSRLLTFLSMVPAVHGDADLHEQCRTLSRDIQSLSEHASFISGNITFLLDASLGLINVEQNAIIKIFSIASVVFLPPTLLASIYGMNFDFMPELKWAFGYPASLLGMLVSAIVPFFFFRWKGWL